MERFETGSRNCVYRLPVTAFPGMEVNVYVVIAGEYRVLIDTGSGYGQANDELLEGFGQIANDLGQDFGIESLTHVLITHAHIDHFGGIPFIQRIASPVLGVHTLDKRILANYEETLILASRNLDRFFLEAGIERDQRETLMELYRVNKALFHSVNVDLTYDSLGMRMGPFEMLHVPGHTAGHVLIRIDGCVFTGDHILQDISPHQAPEHLTPSTGLEHYLQSLDKAQCWLEEAAVVFPGHKAPIKNAGDVIARIKAVHDQRLRQVLDICATPKTIKEISRELFREVRGYHVLLALEEAGAHVEYLHQHNRLKIENLDAVENTPAAVPLYYQTIQSKPKDTHQLIL